MLNKRTFRLKNTNGEIWDAKECYSLEDAKKIFAKEFTEEFFIVYDYKEVKVIL